MFISVNQLESSEQRYANVGHGHTGNDDFDLSEEAVMADVAPEAIKGNILNTDENLTKRKEMLSAVSPEPVDFAYERAIGENDSVYSNFVELIRNAKQKVGRIAIKEGIKITGYATGFMVAPKVMLTNWHVFKQIEDVADSEIQFFYEYNISGNPVTPLCFKLDSSHFYISNKELDYCFVGVEPLDTSGKTDLNTIGYIFLDPSLGKLGSEHKEELNIIHHPDGDYMQLSIRENLFIKITPTSIWYETDTAPGSSGSPVFNDQWQVVALHHMGVGKKNAQGNYIDKNGEIIPQIDGKIDASKVVWEANEGIRISVILKDLIAKCDNKDILSSITTPSVNKPTPNFGHIIYDEETGNKKQPEHLNSPFMEPNSNMINIAIPASLIEKNGTINININQGMVPANALPPAPAISTDEELFAEIKKLEQSIDYSNCKGYQPGFLNTGINIPLPQPQNSIKKFIAKTTGTDNIVLKYYLYSVIFHSVRMVPVISAINVDGDAGKRKDNSPRKDVWLRDSRLSFDIQLGDEYYKRSGFDRGHMSRREDANWGATAEEAKRNADLTCMYTNACPQVAKLNQSSKKGLWGILEKVVLESGAEQENGSTGKISVFNGPIFKEDDPVFRGIQVPMDFYKIVLWITNARTLKATAFKLSQTKLVSDIDFEQLDIDQNTEFKEYQCSIEWLHENTKMDFSGLFAYDTFEGSKNDSMEIKSAFEITTHIKKHNN